jgi:hypothetical protein
MPATTTTCTLVAALVWGCLTLPAWGQDVRLLDCAQVQFFGPACVPVAPLPPAPPPLTPSVAPLFSPDTMAPDTPPLLLKLLEEPRVDNARAFLDWQQHRAARITAVQQLLRQLTRPSPPPTR